MIIKLHSPLSYARHKEIRKVKPLTLKDRIKADRLVMIILLLMTVIGAVISA